MNWYKGDISSAIQKTQMEKKLFLVYIEDNSDQSKRMQDTWDNEKVSSCCSESTCVAVRLHSTSEQGIQFASCYPLLFVPCTYLINQAGVPTDIIPGYLSPDDLLDKLKKTIQDTFSNQNAAESVSQSEQNQSMNENITTMNEPVTSQNDPYTDMPDLENEESINTPYVQNSDELQGRVARAEQLITETQREKEKKEQEDARIQERNRRKEGQDVAKSKRERADRQNREWATDLAKKKAEEKAAREAVREQIRRDQAEKAVRFEAEKEENLKQRETRRAKAEQQKPEIPTSERTSTRLQFRLPDGSNVTNEFPAEDIFQNVLDFVLQNVCPKYTNVKLATVYPRHEFKDEEMSSTLRDLNLVPNAALIVIPSQQGAVATGNNSGILEFIMFILAPIIALVEWLKSLFAGSDNSMTANATKEPQDQPIATTSRRENPSKDRVPHDGNAYRKEGNVYKFKQDDDDDDDNNTWNGNSTQQM